jgi:hypothetical protein
MGGLFLVVGVGCKGMLRALCSRSADPGWGCLAAALTRAGMIARQGEKQREGKQLVEATAWGG